MGAFHDWPTAAGSELGDGGTLWKPWVQARYGAACGLEYANTVWLTMFYADHVHGAEVLATVLRTAFDTLPWCNQVAFLLPASTPMFTPLKATFAEVAPDAGSDAPAGNFRLFKVDREDYIQTLNVRVANVEDSDDLMPIFNAQSEVLSERYGEFFLAGLIENQTEHHKTLVGEVGEGLDSTAVGLMSITDVVAVDALQQCFELEPYDYLVKPVPPEPELEVEEEVVEEEEVAVMPTADANGDEEDSDDEYADIIAKRKAEEAARLRALQGPMEEEEEEEAEEEREEEEVESNYDEEFEMERATMIPEEGQLETNCFAVTLFCLSDVVESRSIDFLKPAFKQYPNLEYCIMTVPHDAAEIPLLDYFTLVPTKPGSTYHHVLYIAHRDTLLNNVVAREAVSHDLAGVANLLAGLSNSTAIMACYRDYLNRMKVGLQKESDALRAQATREGLLSPSLTAKDGGGAADDAAGKDGDAAAAPQQFQPLRFSNMTPEDAAAKVHTLLGAEFRSWQEHVDFKPTVPHKDDLERTASFVLTADGAVVGIAVVRMDLDVDYLRCNYELDDFLELNLYKPRQHIMLQYLAINPIFRPRLPLFLKGIMRQLNRHTVFYRDFMDREIPEIILQRFLQVRPRRQLAHRPSPVDDSDPFALSLMSNRLLSEPRANVNTRIVVVGASDCGLSFIESLLFVPYLNFTNVTLVSPSGLPTGDNDWMPATLAYPARLLLQLDLDDRVHVAESVMVDIDREEKIIVLDEGASLPYDYLVITSGLQDQTIEKMRGGGTLIEGVFSLSNEEDVENVKSYIHDEFQNSDAEAVVYGSTVAAYTAIQGLLSMGIGAERIRLVMPPSERDYTAFNDPYVDERMAVLLHELDIPVERDLTINKLEHDDEGALIAVGLERRSEVVRFPCELLLCCDEPDIDADVFKALNNNSLVYDGRLVINSAFQTNDQSIFAAGTMVKFSRRYYTRLPIEYCDTKEVGQKLAEIMLPILDPGVDDDELEREDKLPTFSRPVCKQAIVPGDLQYFCAQTAKVPTSLAAQQESKYGRDLTTEVKEAGFESYVRIHVDQYDKIESVTYLGRARVELENLLCLVGLPQTYLNRLVSRYDEGLITDFIAFTRENWAMALYHDRIDEFRAYLKLQSRANPEMSELERRVRDWIKNDEPIDQVRMDELRSILPYDVNQVAQQELISYITNNRAHLHMYYVPTPDMKFSHQQAWKAL